MKNLFIWLMLLLPALFVASAQTAAVSSPSADVPEAILKDIQACISEGSSDRLATFFDERVEITMQEKREMYAREQAKFVLRQFFKDNPPSAFTIVHRGKAVQNAYALGEYISKNGRRYKVNIFLNEKNGTFFVDHIRFEGKDIQTAANMRVGRSIPQEGN